MRQEDMFQTATSSQQDTHANHSVSLGSEKAQKMTATSGRTSAKLLHPKDPLGAFSRMFMGTSHWDSTKCLLTWKPKATPQGRLLFQLAVSMPTTKETESGLLHTPTAKGNQWPTPRDTQRVQGFRASWEQKSQTHERQALSLCRGERPAKTYWQAEPRVGRVVDGIPRRVDRIKGLGNAIVPQIAHRIGNTIKEYERSTST
jgi:site-specific DNA-cytosine methylase